MDIKKVGVGTIKYLGKTGREGVIARQDSGSSAGQANEVYFKLDDKAPTLRKGQLVQFVLKEDGDKLSAEASEVGPLGDILA